MSVRDNQIEAEVVWNDGINGGTGGGFSEFFGLPDWQSTAVAGGLDEKRFRGVPDVAAHAAPQAGYIIRTGRQDVVVGGTTASATLWAGLIARINQGVGRNLGFFNPLLYQILGPAHVLRDITDGDNKLGEVGYVAQSGWDPCTGLGSPDGRKLLEAVRSHYQQLS